jgi:hypothetical protein
MRRTICIAATIGLATLGGRALAAEDDNADQRQSKNLEPLYRAVRELVLKYYPQAVVTSSYDKANDSDKIHFQFNTQIYMRRFRDKDGQWQAPVPVRGPFVGGIWGDMALLKGRYAGDVAGAENGVTSVGPQYFDYYSRLDAPYSKKLDRHLLVTLRFPGGTPPGFLKRFDALVKDFESYAGKPDE